MEFCRPFFEMFFVVCCLLFCKAWGVSVIHLRDVIDLKVFTFLDKAPKAEHKSVVVEIRWNSFIWAAALVDIDLIVFSENKMLKIHFTILVWFLQNWCMYNFPRDHVLVFNIIVNFNTSHFSVPLKSVDRVEDCLDEWISSPCIICKNVGSHLNWQISRKPQMLWLCYNIWWKRNGLGIWTDKLLV